MYIVAQTDPSGASATPVRSPAEVGDGITSAKVSTIEPPDLGEVASQTPPPRAGLIVYEPNVGSSRKSHCPVVAPAPSDRVRRPEPSVQNASPEATTWYGRPPDPATLTSGGGCSGRGWRGIPPAMGARPVWQVPARAVGAGVGVGGVVEIDGVGTAAIEAAADGAGAGRVGACPKTPNPMTATRPIAKTPITAFAGGPPCRIGVGSRPPTIGSLMVARRAWGARAWVRSSPIGRSSGAEHTTWTSPHASAAPRSRLPSRT